MKFSDCKDCVITSTLKNKDIRQSCNKECSKFIKDSDKKFILKNYVKNSKKFLDHQNIFYQYCVSKVPPKDVLKCNNQKNKILKGCKKCYITQEECNNIIDLNLLGERLNCSEIKDYIAKSD
jgi:hypothetical protein